MRVPWIIVFAIVLHLTWGILLIADQAAGFVTAISDTREFFGLGNRGLGGIYLAVALVAVASFWLTGRGWRIAAVIPQQFMLFLSAVAAAEAIIGAQFADGVTRPRAFLWADQQAHIINFVLHGLAVLDREGVTIFGTSGNRWIWNRYRPANVRNGATGASDQARRYSGNASESPGRDSGT